MKLSLSENIARLRRAAGLTQERLAEALGVSFAAVSKWERGAATPRCSGGRWSSTAAPCAS